MKNIAVVFTLVLAGCSTPGSVSILPSIESQRAMPLEAMKECPPATPLNGATVRDLVNKLAEVGPAYKECSAKQKELSDFIKRGQK